MHRKGRSAMYQPGDQIVYGSHGVCNIVALEIKTIDRKKVEYYVLSPIERNEARFYVPTQNQVAVSKLRPVLTKEELDTMLKDPDVLRDCWIADENRRKLVYREMINSTDRGRLIGMVHTLHLHREQQRKSGRKFHLCDENSLRDAEKLLNEEISLVLNIPVSQVEEYIHKTIAG